MALWLSCSPSKPGVVGLIPGFSSLSDETLNRGPMTIFQDKLLTRTDCDEAGDYVVRNVLSPRDLVFRPDIEHKLYHHHIYVQDIKTTGFIDFDLKIPLIFAISILDTSIQKLHAQLS